MAGSTFVAFKAGKMLKIIQVKKEKPRLKKKVPQEKRGFKEVKRLITFIKKRLIIQPITPQIPAIKRAEKR